MPRIARVVVTDCPYHVTHRGNRKDPIFFDGSTRRTYLRLLQRYAERYGMELWAYCLMSNHVHLIVVARLADSLARAVGNAHREYSRCINQARGWTGHLWANRFYSTAMDESHLWNAVRYVESNPTRAGLVARAIDYPWSSARVHAGLTQDGLLANGRPFPGAIADWGTWLDAGAERSDYAVLRRNTSTGRPSGGEAFVSRLERQLGRRMPVARVVQKTPT